MPNLRPLTALFPSSELQKLQALVPEGHTPIWKHWEEFVIQHCRLGKSLATIRSVRSGIRVLVRRGEVYSIELANDPKSMTQITLDLQDQYSLRGNTRNTYLKNLNTYFIWLEKNEYIAENKVRKVPKSTAIFHEQTCLDHEKAMHVFAHLRVREFGSTLERLRTILYVELLAYTGARPSELLAMPRDSIYQDRRWMIRIDGKKLKGRIRYYDCPQYLIHLFLCYQQVREKFGRDEDSLFVSMSSLNGWTKSGVDNFFKRLSVEIGFQVNSYAFRRYVATQLDAQGVPVQDIGRHLGHLRTSTTERYIERSGILTRTTSAAMAFANKFSSAGATQSTLPSAA